MSQRRPQVRLMPGRRFPRLGKSRSMWLVLALFFISIPGIPGYAQDDSGVSFEESGCPFQVPAGQTIDCGVLTVPENYDEPDGTKIRLTVAIARHPDGNPEPDPIIYLEGGPGGSPLELLWLTFENIYAPMFAANRDIILFDQRGIGTSEPALDCPAVGALTEELLDYEYEGETLDVSEVNQRLLDAYQECGTELSAEHDLSQYNSANNARDVEALRTALGYEQVNLWGISYGTRLGLTVLRDYPQGVRSAVLDSVYPPDVNLLTDTPTNFVRALNVLFDSCEQDVVCNEAYPNLRDVFYETIDALNENPVRFTIRDIFTGEEFPETVFTGSDMFAVTVQLLYDTGSLPALPGLIYDAANGDFGDYALILGSLLAQQEVISLGMNFAVQCQEELTFTQPGEIEAAYEGLDELESIIEFSGEVVISESQFEICAAFNAGTSPDMENEPVSSDVSALVVTGEFDPITPPSWGVLAAETLRNSQYIEFPGAGHGPTGTQECAQSIAAAYFNDPTAPVDTSCVDEMGIQFIPPADMEQAPVIEFAPLDLSEYGIEATTVIPASWQEQQTMPGVAVFARAESSLDQTAVLVLSVPGVTSVDQIVTALATQFNLGDEPLRTITTDAAEWSLYTVSVQGTDGYAGITTYENSGVLILLLGTEQDRDSVLIPMLEAFAPPQ